MNRVLTVVLLLYAASLIHGITTGKPRVVNTHHADYLFILMRMLSLLHKRYRGNYRLSASHEELRLSVVGCCVIYTTKTHTMLVTKLNVCIFAI